VHQRTRTTTTTTTTTTAPLIRVYCASKPDPAAEAATTPKAAHAACFASPGCSSKQQQDNS